MLDYILACAGHAPLILQTLHAAFGYLLFRTHPSSTVVRPIALTETLKPKPKMHCAAIEAKKHTMNEDMCEDMCEAFKI